MSGSNKRVIAITFRAISKFFGFCSDFRGVSGCGMNGPMPIMSASIDLKNKMSSANDEIVCSGRPTRQPVPTS